ncbi:MAG: hypothetical protein NTX65_14905 [Ignavibacteriales bacterium]|nr:hypothetical protein [Ignavibacteriales bacterium]
MAEIMDSIFQDLLYWFLTLAVSYIVFWYLVALIYAKSNTSSTRLEETVLTGFFLASLVHLMFIVFLLVFLFLYYDYTLLLIQMISLVVLFLFDIVMAFIFFSKKNNLPAIA